MLLHVVTALSIGNNEEYKLQGCGHMTELKLDWHFVLGENFSQPQFSN